MPLKSRRGFTLIELLVVIAIIAVLAVVVILSLNPAELLRQARDSSRLSDMATLNQALNIYSQDLAGNFMGNVSTTYVSIPDPSATSTAGDQCQGLGLPALPAGSVYQCASSSSYRNTDGTGWLPANFSNITIGSPLGALPYDTSNQSSTNLYYTYSTDGTKFALASVAESTKQRAALSTGTNGSLFPGVNVQGSAPSLSQLFNPSGLLVYYNFEEGAGSSTLDLASGLNGAWTGASVGTNSTHYTGGRVGNFAGDFDGTTNFVTAPSTLASMGTTSSTLMAWVNCTGSNAYDIISNRHNNPSWDLDVPTRRPQAAAIDSSADILENPITSLIISDGTWYMLAGVLDRSANIVTVYLNAASSSASSSATLVGSLTNGNFTIGANATPANRATCLIDDARIYGRALSLAEIRAIYNAEK